MEVIFHEVLKNPPTKWILERKKIKLDENFQVVPDDTYYLTANLFYDGTHWAIKSKIMRFAKEWIVEHLRVIPELEKCRIHLTYHHHKDGFDLDNKLYFWAKVLLDILKTPSEKQLENAKEYGNEIITTNTLKDDTVRYVDGINMEYKRGATALEIKITGRRQDVQTALF